jgi:hypothetical protein
MVINPHNNINQLLLNFPILGFDATKILHWDMLHVSSIMSIAGGLGILPQIPPLEKHPYLQPFLHPLNNNINATGLMIGTFPPITYLCSQLNFPNITYNNQTFHAPNIDFFHGNKGSLWKYAPINFHLIQLNPTVLQPALIANALNEAGIIYSDIVKYTQRKLNRNNEYDASDENLTSIIPNVELIHFVFQSDSINRLYFTNASFFVKSTSFFNNLSCINLKANDAFGLFIKSALDEGYKIEITDPNNLPIVWISLDENPKPALQRMAINNFLSTKVFLTLKLTKDKKSKVYEICSCASPAAVNRNAHRNPCCVQFGNINNVQGVNAAVGLLEEVLLCFFNDQLWQLAQYNQ